MRMVILADDFTGSLDTGVQFAQEGIATRFYADIHHMQEALRRGEKEVYILHTNTRHLSPEAAYERLYHYGKVIAAENPDIIFKKTDSGLRGKLGEEMAAVMEAAKGTSLHFIPSYPGMNRITRQGIHYIDGVPVAKSVYGRDPFDGVHTSRVESLLRGAGKPVHNRSVHSLGSRSDQEQGIIIWDAESDECIRSICERIFKDAAGKAHGVLLLAGCAGLAHVLAGMLPFHRREQKKAYDVQRLAVVCGSVNDITREQVLHARHQGFAGDSADMNALLGPERGKEREKLLSGIRSCVEEECPWILDTGFPTGQEIEAFSRQHGCSVVELGEKIAASLGALAKDIFEREKEAVLMIIGGDTLQGFMNGLEYDELVLIGEIAPGAIMLELVKAGDRRLLLTKSGGFGRADLLTQIIRNPFDTRKRERRNGEWYEECYEK